MKEIIGDDEGKEKVYSTRYSQEVFHPGTNRARRRLASVIGREPVFSTWYGRRHCFLARKLTYTCSLFCSIRFRK